jgi:hypothetical protein
MSRRKPAAISKSRYVSGLQCDKRLWIEVHARESIPPIDAATQAIFDQGTEVGQLATQLFPGGIEIGRMEYRWNVVVPATQKALTQRRPLFEAAFRAGGAACRVDVLNPVEDNAWDLYEVKSSTSLKDVHCNDVALQAYVLHKTGLEVRNCYLTHVNNEYVRNGPLETAELFVHQDITEQVNARISSIETSLEHMASVLGSDEEPHVQIGAHCTTPYSCPLIERCWSFLPRQNVLTLYGDRRKGFALLERGVTDLRAIPPELETTDKQTVQVEAAISRRPQVDADAIRDFLQKLKYPLYYFDIETLGPAVPKFDGTRSYQQIPFQYSLHITAGPQEPPQHSSFLADGQDDPRPHFLEHLQRNIGPQGSVVAYNAAFEKGILSATSLALPEYGDWIAAFLDRFVDLLAPFRAFHYYHPDQLGSASIKAVLPALVGNSYKDLAISDGQMASQQFSRITYGSVDEAERQQVRQQLEDYCALDTLAMVEIVNQLQELSAD